MYLPEGLQQDAELLCPAQRKYRDQHLMVGEADSGGSHWPHYLSLNTAGSKMFAILLQAGRMITFRDSITAKE